MKMTKLELISMVETDYTMNPGLLPTAFWKFREWMMHEKTCLKIVGKSIHVVRDGVAQLIYPLNVTPQFDSLQKYGMTILHKKQSVGIDGFKKKSYFKLKHDLKNVLEPKLHQEYYFERVAVRQFHEIEYVLKNCYKNLNMNVEIIQSWTKRAVYDEELWVWVIEKRTGKKAGLGIAEIDESIGEGALEWIQVLEEHRGKGLAKSIVQYLLYQFVGKVEFVTVSGEIDNETNPENLYRNCGFYGDDVWDVYRKEEKHENN